MNPATELAPQLKQLRLSGILDSLDARNRQAIDAKLAYTEFLALLIQDEVARREQKKFATRLRGALISNSYQTHIKLVSNSYQTRIKLVSNSYQTRIKLGVSREVV